MACDEMGANTCFGRFLEFHGNPNTPIIVKDEGSVETAMKLDDLIKAKPEYNTTPIIWQGTGNTTEGFKFCVEELIIKNPAYYPLCNGNIFERKFSDTIKKAVEKNNIFLDRLILGTNSPHTSYGASRVNNPLNIAVLICELYQLLGSNAKYNRLQPFEVCNLMATRCFDLFPRDRFQSLNMATCKLYLARELTPSCSKYFGSIIDRVPKQPYSAPNAIENKIESLLTYPISEEQVERFREILRTEDEAKRTAAELRLQASRLIGSASKHPTAITELNQTLSGLDSQESAIGNAGISQVKRAAKRRMGTDITNTLTHTENPDTQKQPNKLKKVRLEPTKSTQKDGIIEIIDRTPSNYKPDSR